MRLAICLLALLMPMDCGSSGQKIEVDAKRAIAVRKPLIRVPVKLEVPPNYEKSDLPDGKLYDHKPHVVVTDEKAGKYEFRWIGSDRKQKTVKYQRLGAIDVLVSATIEKGKNGKYLYRYIVENLSSSAVRLSGFTVQTFAKETEPIQFDYENSYIGPMSDVIKGFTEGKWWHFGIHLSHMPIINPGSRIELHLESPALPGLVECKANGGEFGTTGVGEEMPPELERLFMGTKDWPYGFTIGPIDGLLEMDTAERSIYLVENLGKFQEAGWMSSETVEIYQRILKRKNLAGALAQANKDIEKGFITSEVFHIIEGLNQNY